MVIPLSMNLPRLTKLDRLETWDRLEWLEWGPRLNWTEFHHQNCGGCTAIVLRNKAKLWFTTNSSFFLYWLTLSTGVSSVRTDRTGGIVLLWEPHGSYHLTKAGQDGAHIVEDWGEVEQRIPQLCLASCQTTPSPGAAVTAVSAVRAGEEGELCKIASINHGQLPGCVSNNDITVTLLIIMNQQSQFKTKRLIFSLLRNAKNHFKK